MSKKTSTNKKFKPAAGKTWTSKVNDPKKTHKVEVLDKDWTDMVKGERMLIATPLIIDTYLKQIPTGKDVSMTTMRKDLAIQYNADNMCPLTAGIFLRIAAEAALEQLGEGKRVDQVAPFWRVVNSKMAVAKKLSCGVDYINQRREKEQLPGTTPGQVSGKKGRA